MYSGHQKMQVNYSETKVWYVPIFIKYFIVEVKLGLLEIFLYFDEFFIQVLNTYFAEYYPQSILFLRCVLFETVKIIHSRRRCYSTIPIKPTQPVSDSRKAASYGQPIHRRVGTTSLEIA